MDRVVDGHKFIFLKDADRGCARGGDQGGLISQKNDKKYSGSGQIYGRLSLKYTRVMAVLQVVDVVANALNGNKGPISPMVSVTVESGPVSNGVVLVVLPMIGGDRVIPKQIFSDVLEKTTTKPINFAKSIPSVYFREEVLRSEAYYKELGLICRFNNFFLVLPTLHERMSNQWGPIMNDGENTKSCFHFVWIYILCSLEEWMRLQRVDRGWKNPRSIQFQNQSYFHISLHWMVILPRAIPHEVVWKIHPSLTDHTRCRQIN